MGVWVAVLRAAADLGESRLRSKGAKVPAFIIFEQSTLIYIGRNGMILQMVICGEAGSPELLLSCGQRGDG